jgi:hypothetical protein
MSKPKSNELAPVDSKELVSKRLKIRFLSIESEAASALGKVLEYALMAAGSLKVILTILKLWIEERKGRRIKIKKGDFELELQGTMSKKEIDAKIKTFMDAVKDIEGEKVKILLP